MCKSKFKKKDYKPLRTVAHTGFLREGVLNLPLCALLLTKFIRSPVLLYKTHVPTIKF